MTDRDELNSLAAGYALGALSRDEAAAYETLLAESEEARAEAVALADTATQLGLAAEPAEPSPALRANLLALIAQTPQLAPLPRLAPSPQLARSSRAAADGEGAKPRPEGQSTPQSSADLPSAAHPHSATAGLSPAERKASARWRFRPVTLVAAAAVAAALFVGGTVVGQSLTRNDFEITQATALAQLQTADDARQVNAEVAGGAEATLIWSDDQQRSVIMINGLEPLGSGETYQLWYIGESGAVPAGTFEAAESGVSWRVLDGQMSAGDVVGVTVEPTGGSKQPTTDPIVALASV